MTDVSPCSHKPLDIAFDYDTVVKVFLDNADRDLMRSNISTDCPEPTPHPRRKGVLRTIQRLACRMKRLQVSFTDRLVEAVLGNCQCSYTTGAPGGGRQDNRLCHVKRFLYSIRECYQRLYTRSQLTKAGRKPPP